MESANGVIKTECLYNKFGKSKFKNRQIPIDEVVAEIAPFIEYYNNERPKQSLGGLSPVQFREHNPKGTYLMVIKDLQKTPFLGYLSPKYKYIYFQL